MRGIFLLLLLSVRIPAIYIYLNDIGLIGTSFFFQVPIENKKNRILCVHAIIVALFCIPFICAFLNISQTLYLLAYIGYNLLCCVELV